MVQLLTLYTDPVHHNAQVNRLSEGRMPIADHTVYQYDWLNVKVYKNIY